MIDRLISFWTLAGILTFVRQPCGLRAAKVSLTAFLGFPLEVAAWWSRGWSLRGFQRNYAD
jgi:hypothetical protein